MRDMRWARGHNQIGKPTADLVTLERQLDCLFAREVEEIESDGIRDGLDGANISAMQEHHRDTFAAWRWLLHGNANAPARRRGAVAPIRPQAKRARRDRPPRSPPEAALQTAKR